MAKPRDWRDRFSNVRRVLVFAGAVLTAIIIATASVAVWDLHGESCVWRHQSAIITVGVLCAVIGFVIRGRALAVQFRRGDRQAAELARAAKALRESESRFRAVIGFGKPDPTIALRSSPATAMTRCSQPSLCR
jgi:hypothetical protein